MTHLLPAKDYLRKIGSIGILLPNLEARIIASDEDSIIDAAPGEPGELWVRGPIVMKGYLNNLTATANSVTSDGWFKTGDIAVIDEEGYYKIVDRKKELIKYKVRLMTKALIVILFNPLRFRASKVNRATAAPQTS